jgi:hypothetical protein
MAVGPQTTRLVPYFSRVIAVLLGAVCVVVEVALIAYGDLGLTLRATPALAFVAVGGVALFWAPLVELNPAELVIVNPLREHRISWPAIRDVDTRWSLTIDTVRGRVTAWAAPAPGMISQFGRLRRDSYGRPSLGRQEARHTSTGDLVRRQWESYRDEGVLGAVEGRGVTTTWNVPLTAALVVTAALTVAAIAVR